MIGSDLRKLFLKFFEERNHRAVPSSPLIPAKDPTLLFTNAGMNQFKGVFTGEETRGYKRATSSQKCIRVSGKHNDLENVGRTARHHTFFEMLGNFSFGDYFKDEAITYAWDLFTKTLSLPKDKLWVSVYEEDDDAAELWKKIAGVADGQIYRFGKKDNYWSMGDTGPNGPCSEIGIDRGEHYSCGRPTCEVGCDCDRYLELWNLVFMQFETKESGETVALPNPSIDTGMGLERIAAVMQDSTTNYDTDLFMPIISETEGIVGKSYNKEEFKVAFRVIADHVRALTFAFSEGILPSNEGRGYVLRRILRRTARHGHDLGMQDPFVFRLSGVVVDIMKGAYPDLVEKREHVAMVIKSEEEKFSRTLHQGLQIFESIVSKTSGKTISGKDAFTLYDTFGFPLDLTEDISRERGMAVDVAGFNNEMSKQKERSREGSKFKVFKDLVIEYDAEKESNFVGYGKTDVETEIIDYDFKGANIYLRLAENPFYAEAGGQVGDIGYLVGNGYKIEIQDTIKLDGDDFLVGRLIAGEIDPDKKIVEAVVDVERRKSIMRNHSATHLLHAALRNVLGKHVQQSGSLVAPNRLRFDFTHFLAVDARTLEIIETEINDVILANLTVTPIDDVDFEKATKEMGAMAFFGDKYGDRVRVIDIKDYSRELCGGTHVNATGEIGQLLVVSEGSIASSVRRVEALTGDGALKYINNLRRQLKDSSEILKVQPDEVVHRLERLLEDRKVLEDKLDDLRQDKDKDIIQDLVDQSKVIDGLRLASARVQVSDISSLREMGDILRNKIKSGIGVLGAEIDGKVALIVVVTDDLIKKQKISANDIIKDIAKLIGGTGGGKPHLAQAGGKDVGKLNEAIAKAPELIQERLRG